MCSSFVQPEKQLDPMISSVLGNETSDRFEHPLKTVEPIETTPSGTAIDDKLVQPLNALSEMLVIFPFVSKTTSFKDVHPSKAWGNDLLPPPITTRLRFVQPENALRPSVYRASLKRSVMIASGRTTSRNGVRKNVHIPSVIIQFQLYHVI